MAEFVRQHMTRQSAEWPLNRYGDQGFGSGGNSDPIGADRGSADSAHVVPGSVRDAAGDHLIVDSGAGRFIAQV